ncbi:hypothetical protein LAUMK7_04439 [Mycobacterium kansasii]|nr:hypothetical protein MKANGN_30040 [Mycobacterium kansasii]VAZ61992.1 hypothetical protein LAUMK22_03812 [Mycobacterium kansasii]VAZ68426.1 hypothetical protein LAUMK40_04578 [Mycobacterium kansasii]VAZ78661.1 hypothetical protein LAUMK7_04439 [Mycobacterium kansasii]VTP01978.1 hypothetical protein BIN_B_03204 [Mycobacterium kansasii]
MDRPDLKGTQVFELLIAGQIPAGAARNEHAAVRHQMVNQTLRVHQFPDRPRLGFTAQADNPARHTG